ncbi:MAG TPA: quinoprotein relay system zinc metallohydrolase 2 [Methylocella sp.]|nr:quinoprotein relay system zinc metallohydrolase 2 [Methylocella sp.]
MGRQGTTETSAAEHLSVASAHATRREVLQGGFCLCCFPTAAGASTGPFAMEEVAKGIHIRRGIDEDATKTNENAIANTGFILGRDCVLVTDPGGSLADGERLRASIAQATALPIKYVVMNHVHPDHVFGASAFLKDDPVFVGHARLAEVLQQRGSFYREKLSAILGPERTGTVVTPGMEIQDRAEIDLGGRVIEVTAHAPAHTVCDVSLFDQSTGTLLPGDLLFVQRAPALDGSLRGWRKTLEDLKQLNATRAVPGHGPAAVDWPSASFPLGRYLSTLERDTRRAIAGGTSIDEAMKTVGASERGEWKLFDDYNGRNAAEAYKELEWD